MEHIKQYIEENKDRFLAELMDMLRIPSVSADSKYKEDVQRNAEFVKNSLIEAVMKLYFAGEIGVNATISQIKQIDKDTRFKWEKDL